VQETPANKVICRAQTSAAAGLHAGERVDE
jgi:hypothetical protein